MTARYWRTAVRLAWRELRNSPARAALIVVAMTVSIASIGGVDSAAGIARRALEGDSRAWLAGDLCVDAAEPVDQSQADELNALHARGIDWTLVTTSFTMAGSDQAADPAMIFVKAVDPRAYPFYGSLGIAPTQSLESALGPSDVIVSKEVLERLQVQPGAAITIGGQPFRISARVDAEPDRFAGQMGSIGLRCILSRDAYTRTGIARAANAVKDRVLLRIPEKTEVADARRALEEIFSGGSVRDFRGAYRQQTESVISFLGVTAFLTLALGAIGVATAVRQHAEDSMARLAVMKMLGAQPRQVTAVFGAQIAMMTGAALTAGIPLGYMVRVSILSLVGNYLVLPPIRGFDAGTIFEGMGAAMLALAPALLEPIGMIRRLRPSVLLRRDLDPRKMERSWIAAAVAIAGFALLAARLLRSWRSAAILAGALVLVLGIAFALSVAMLRGLRRLHYPSVALRHGVAGLYRPGNRSGALIAVLATALTLMVATFELSGVVAHAVFDVLPYDRNSLYVAGFRESYREPLRAFLEKLPGVDSVEILSEARMRLLSVDGLDYAFLKGEIHTVVCDSVSSAAAGPARLMVADDRARLLKAHVGMRVDFDSHDRVVHARVAEVRKFTPAERFWSTLRLDCSGLDDAALFHQAAIHVRPEKISAVRAAIAGRYPTLAVVSADDVSETVSGVSRDAMVLTRVVAWYAIAGGWCVLIALVAASRPARLNELGILSSLGATRRAIVRIYTVEFAVVGLASAMIASILTIGFTMAGMSVIFGRIEAAVEWPVAAAAVVLSVIATIGAAWFPAAGLLRMKPMDILRRH